MSNPLKLQLVITADGKQAKTEIENVRTTVGTLTTPPRTADPLKPISDGAGKAASAVKLTAGEIQNLSFQMNDIAMGLATGQSPFTVMMQQGMQVSQIMGSRGLGSVLPALAGGIASLINPTALALAAVTALGYGAAAVFSSMGGGIKSVDDVLADHETAIKALKEAWGEAGKGLDDYLARTPRSVAFDLQSSAEETRAALERSARDALTSMAFFTWSGDAAAGDVTAQFNVEERFAPFRKAIEELRASIEAGKPDIVAFRDEVERIAEAEPANATLRDLAKELRASTDQAYELARALPSAEQAIDGTALAAERATKAHEAWADAIARVGKAQSEGDVTAAFGAASHHARTMGEALAAAAEAERKLMELSGKGMPVPSAATGATPNREDVIAEREARLARTERAYAKVSGAIEEATARAQLEQALIGASLAMRNRAAAAIEAEREIRARNLDQMGAEAEGLRGEARALADLRTEAALSAEAWSAFKSAGESAIDGVVERLAEGDISGALAGLAKDIQRTILQLGVSNPIKNLLFGGDNPTFGNLTQGGGLIAQLLGLKTPGADAVASAVDKVAATMHVTAATVIVNGGIGLGGGGLGIQDIVGGLGGGAANDNSVAGQIWNYFSGKGLKPHHVAGIVGNFAQESGFNPLAIGDGGTSYGLPQAHGPRAAAFLDFIGGKGNLGDVSKQLDFVWKELQGSESAAFKRLLASGNVREATAAFAGFERPRGWSLDNPEAAHGFANRLTQAEEALTKFGQQAGPAANALTGLGKDATTTASTLASAAGGLDAAGKAMKAAALAFPAAPSAPGGGLLSGLFRHFISSGALAAIGGNGPAIGLYDTGGYTGDGARRDVAGLVHRGEYVFDAAATRSIGVDNLEALRRGALRGYEAGGFVGGRAPSAPAGAGATEGARNIHVTVGVSVDGNGNLRPFVESVTEAGLGQYDRALPSRVAQIQRDPRRK